VPHARRRPAQTSCAAAPGIAALLGVAAANLTIAPLPSGGGAALSAAASSFSAASAPSPPRRRLLAQLEQGEGLQGIGSAASERGAGGGAAGGAAAEPREPPPGNEPGYLGWDAAQGGDLASRLRGETAVLLARQLASYQQRPQRPHPRAPRLGGRLPQPGGLDGVAALLHAGAGAANDEDAAHRDRRLKARRGARAGVLGRPRGCGVPGSGLCRLWRRCVRGQRALCQRWLAACMTPPPLMQGSRASGCGDCIEAGRRSSTMPYPEPMTARRPWQQKCHGSHRDPTMR